MRENSIVTCKECPFAVYHMSFGGRGNRTCGWRCKIIEATGIRDNGSIFEINCDEAKMMDIQPILTDMGFGPTHHLVFDSNLDRHLPSPFSPSSYWRDEEWNPEYHVARWVLGQQECFVTAAQVEEFVEVYSEYEGEARGKVKVASDELVEMRYWVQKGQAMVGRKGL